MTIGSQTIAPDVRLDELTTTIAAAEVLLFCRDLRGTLIDAAVAAVGRTLAVQPALTAAIEAGVGVAVETADGPAVPVVRNAVDGSLPSVRDEVSRLVGTARFGRLAPADLGGAAVTVCDSLPLMRAVATGVRGAFLTVYGSEQSGLVTISLVVDSSDTEIEAARTFFSAVVRLLRHPYRLLV